jgi:hypothetical protein
MGINRFEAKTGRFEFKIVRFDMKSNRFKPLLTAEGLPWNETKLIAKRLIVIKAGIYPGSRRQTGSCWQLPSRKFLNRFGSPLSPLHNMGP